MATKNTKKQTSTKTTTTVQTKQPLEEATQEAKPIYVKEFDLNQYITVKNGFQGELIYKSKKTGEVFKWDEFGAEQQLELMELRNAKSSYKKFFEKNWFMFDEDWVVDYLGVRQFYKHAIKIEDFDNIFSMSPSEIKSTIKNMSDGQKKSVAYRARVLISEGEIDSNKAIAALEESLGVELVEK